MPIRTGQLLSGDRSAAMWAAFILQVFPLVFDVADGYVARTGSNYIRNSRSRPAAETPL